MKNTNLRSVFIVLFAALICAGCFIAVPVGPGGIPIVLQNMFVVLSSLILGGFGGFWAACIFVAAGALGLPVYSGGTGGIAHIFGPTGGFLTGYIVAALAAGLLARIPSTAEKPFGFSTIIRLSLAALAGYVILYIPGVLWFMHLTGKGLMPTMAACVIPFIPGDIIKLAVTVPVAAKLRPSAARYLTGGK
ncbi:MAG: biotin transporter BioY [Treponema sp.]|nr:biotin transporter BioY [Treponema sp.]